MPKAERGTVKDIANRMKAKGLQKLRFYCQMCAKQCRDENGFKCHLTSDSHLRQMKIFCDNAGGMLDSFSKEFEKSYLDTLYRRHRTKQMNANNVYQEMISDKHHIHMNATKWATLTDFVQYLGKTGKCIVEETERGWYVQYIERDPTLLARQEAYAQRVEAEKREEEKLAKKMEKQRVEAAKLMDKAGYGISIEASNLQRNEESGPIAISLGGASSSASHTTKNKNNRTLRKSVFDDEEDDEEEEDEGEIGNVSDNDDRRQQYSNATNDESQNNEYSINTNSTSGEMHGKRKREEIENTQSHASNSRRRQDESHSSEPNLHPQPQSDIQDIRKKNWIRKDILVRITSKKIISGGKYYKRKGIIIKVHDKYLAEIELLASSAGEDDGGDVIKVDQDDLETVVPNEGKSVIIVNGKGRGMIAELLDVDNKKCRGTLKLKEGDVILKKVDFDDFSKAWMY
jgi:DNA/RNA-binding protein KIN17